MEKSPMNWAFSMCHLPFAIAGCVVQHPASSHTPLGWVVEQMRGSVELEGGSVTRMSRDKILFHRRGLEQFGRSFGS